MSTQPYLPRTAGDPLLATDWNDMQIRIRDDVTELRSDVDSGLAIGADAELKVKSLTAAQSLSCANAYIGKHAAVGVELAIEGSARVGAKTRNATLRFSTADTEAGLVIQTSAAEDGIIFKNFKEVAMRVYKGKVEANRVGSLSDARLKRDVAAIDDPLGRLLQLRGVRFRRIERDDAPAELGFLAQEVEEVLPELVGRNPEGYRTLDYAGFVVPLVEAFKALHARVQSLQDELSGARAQLQALGGRGA